MAVLAGPGWLAVLMTPLALAAAGQATATWRRRRPYRPVAVLGAAVMPMVAVITPLAVALWVLVVAGAAAAVPRLVRRDAASTAAIATVIGTAAAAPVVVRDTVGLLPAVALFLFAHAHDAGAFLVGSGGKQRWEAPAAGVATVAAMTVFIAAVLVPPFRGASPWLVGLLALILTPLGPALATLVLGGRARPVPALRRLDVFVGFGPLFGAAAAAAV